MNSLILRLALLALTTVSILLSGCGSSPAVKYYALSPQLGAGESAANLAIKIGPAEFPRSLDRSQIVTRLSGTQVEVDQFNVWSAPLQGQFLNVLGDNLGAALSADRIVVYPNEASFPLNYQILPAVLEFEGTRGGSVTLRVRWVIAGPDGTALESGLFSQTMATSADGYDALVATHSKLVALLATSLVASIESLAR